MAKPEEQQKLISFRVEEGFLQKFEALKERLSVGGRKITTSDLARSLLEAAQVQHGEFGELLGDQVESIKYIQQLAQTRQPLRKAQWEFVSFLVHRAYQSHRRQMVQGRYFKAALQAFATWRRLLERQGLPTQSDDYFLSNLRRTDTTDLLGRIDELIGTMPELVWTSQAEFGTRNLNVAMRDGIQALNALDLHDALAPFLVDLLPVAIRSVFMQTKRPLHEVEQSYLSSPIKPVESERYSLSVLSSGTSLTAALSLSTHRSINPINSFMQFQDLAQILEEVTPENPSSQSETYWLAGPPVTGSTGYYLRYLGHQMDFSADEFDELRGVFRLAKRQPDLMAALARMTAIYGDI